MSDKHSQKSKAAPAAQSPKDADTSAPAPAETLEESRPRLRIRIRAYDNKIIDQSARQIIETAERIGSEVLGPVPLPTEIRRYTVNRSTFVHKDSRDQYEMRVHKRLIDIVNPTPKLIDSLTNLNLPVGIDIEIKML